MRIKYQLLILLFFVAIVLVNISIRDSTSIQASETSFKLSQKVIKQAKEIAAKELSPGLSARRPEGMSKLDTEEDIRKAIDESMKELDDNEREVQEKGFLKLKYLGNIAFSDIVKGLESENKNVRQWCITLLGYRGSEAVQFLGNVVRSDSDKSIRSSAAHYLGQTYDPNAVSILLDALDYGDYSVQTTVARALGFFRDKRAFEPLKKIIENINANGQVRHAAADAILQIDKENGTKAIQVAITKEMNEYVRHNFNAVLQSAGEWGYWPPDLLEIYQLTKDAVTLAGESYSEKEIRRLVEYIDSPYGAVASGCINALAKLQASETVPEIIAKGSKGLTHYTCLAEIGSPEAVDYLIECIQSKEQNIRVSVVNGLGYAGSRWAVPILIELLDDTSLRTTHKGSVEPIDAFNGIWPDSHKAYIALHLCLSHNGFKSTSVNLASGAKFNIDEEIRRVKEWWNSYGEDFLQGKTVPNPGIKNVYLLT